MKVNYLLLMGEARAREIRVQALRNETTGREGGSDAGIKSGPSYHPLVYGNRETLKSRNPQWLT